MKTTIANFLAIVSLCTSLCGGAFAADGASLFRSSDLVPRAYEINLQRFETDRVAQLRQKKNNKSVTVIPLNRTALESTIVSVATPEGKSYQYIGAKVENSDKSFTWIGKAEAGWLIVSWDSKTAHGEFLADGKTYVIQALVGGPNGVVFEATATKADFIEPTEKAR